MAKQGFEKPNYTQTPNQFFDEHMRDLSGSELKVTLAIIRKTFGFHKEKTRMSLSDLIKITGLSKQAVIDGATGAEAKGMIEKFSDGGVNQWAVKFLDSEGDEGSLKSRQVGVKKVDREGQESRHPSNKETINKKEIAPNGAPLVKSSPIEKKGDPVDGFLFYAQKNHGQIDLSFLGEHLRPLALAFLEAAGSKYTPLKSDYSFWRKTLNEWYERGVTSQQVITGTKTHLKAELSIKSPASVTYAIIEAENKIYTYLEVA